MLNDDQLSAYMNGFYGYGDYAGKYWLVGMEEGGGGFVEDVQRRLAIWTNRGARELEDLAEYHFDLGERRYFEQPIKSQSTWNKLIRIILSAKGENPSFEAVKTHQGAQLGRITGETCLLELLPLPSPSTGHWLYAQYSSLPQLSTREQYRNYTAPIRAKALRERVEKYRPQWVIFYSFNGWYLRWWQVIAGASLQFISQEGLSYYAAENGSTRFFVVKHPAAHGITPDYYHQIGKLLSTSYMP